MNSIKEKFERLSKEIGSIFKKRGVSSKDVYDAIKWARKKQCNVYLVLAKKVYKIYQKPFKSTGP